jgi:hypothetical protein
VIVVIGKNLVDEIINQADFPKKESKSVIAFYLYKELAKRLSFSTVYNNTDINFFYKLHNEKVDATSLISDDVICRTWAQLYSQLLTKCNIDNSIIDLNHCWVEFRDENLDVWTADATIGSYTDLARINYNDNVDNFNPPSQLSKAVVLDELYEKTGYSKSVRYKQLNNLKEDLLKMKDDSSIGTKEKLNYLFERLGNLKSGYYEAKDFVKDLEEYYLLTAEEFKKIKSVELKRTNKDKSVDIVQCIYLNDNDTYSYFLLSPNSTVKEISKDDLKMLQLMGYGVEPDDKKTHMSSIKNFKSFVPGKLSRKAILYKLKVPVEMIYDYDVKMAK